MNGGTEMDVREKLIELLTNSQQLDVLDRATGWKEAANYLIAHGVTVQKWIPVKDKLPEIVSTHKRYRSTIKKSIRVLCVCVQKSGKTMVKEGYCEWYNDYPEPRWQIPGTIDDVTHWMPIPEMQKGE